MASAFVFRQEVLFRHCDPAGIVFFPRFFEMLNDSMEAYFAAVVGMAYSDMLKEHGMPTVALETQFVEACRHGEVLDISVRCRRVGNSSTDFRYEARCGDSLRFTTDSTMVFIDLATTKAKPWPDEIRSAFERDMAGES